MRMGWRNSIQVLVVSAHDNHRAEECLRIRLILGDTTAMTFEVLTTYGGAGLFTQVPRI